MGLFGGFKAKFTRSNKKKEKPVEGVVPLNFRIKTEFDSQQPPNALPIGIRSALRTNTRPRPVIRSATFEETSRALQHKLKSTSISNLPTEPTAAASPPDHEYEEPIAPPKVKPKSNSLKERRVTPVLDNPNNDEYNKTNSIYSSDSIPQNRVDDEYEDVTPSDDYKFPTGENFSESTLILMTQSSASSLASDSTLLAEDKKDREFKSNGAPKGNFGIPPASLDTEDDFKVNVVRHDLRNYASEDDYTEEELDEDYSQYDNGDSLNYSSQASSLFFGASTQPTIPRPRKLLLRNEDEDEEDC